MLSTPFSLRDLQEEITGLRTGNYGVNQAISDSGMPYDSLRDFVGYTAITLDVPTFITANNTEFPDAVSISWGSVTNADEYEYTLTTDINGGGSELGVISNGVSTTFSETWINLSNSVGKDGSIIVKAKKNPSTYSDWSTALTFYLILDAPSITSHTSGHTFIADSTTYTVEYTSITNANEYQRELYNAFDLGGTEQLGTNVVVGNSISLTGNQLKTYIGSSGSFRVRARRNSADHASEWSAYINIYCQDPIGTPTISSPTEGYSWSLGTDVTFSWNSVGDASDYDWELINASNLSLIADGTTAGTSVIYDELDIYNATNLGAEDAQFRVRARNIHQTGTWSAWRTFRVE